MVTRHEAHTPVRRGTAWRLRSTGINDAMRPKSPPSAETKAVNDGIRLQCSQWQHRAHGRWSAPMQRKHPSQALSAPPGRSERWQCTLRVCGNPHAAVTVSKSIQVHQLDSEAALPAHALGLRVTAAVQVASPGPCHWQCCCQRCQCGACACNASHGLCVPVLRVLHLQVQVLAARCGRCGRQPPLLRPAVAVRP